MKKYPDKTNLALWVLRSGLAFVFLYAAVSSLRQPVVWAGYLPGFLTKAIAATTLVKFFAVYELALVVWLLSGKLARYGALLAALTLGGIAVVTPGQFIITFRDVGLACMALALALLEKQ